MKQYIVIAGNIGAGKSTLVERLSSCLGWRPYFEPVSENPYLEDFYADMNTWAFHSQLYFLTDRMRTHKELQDFNGPVVQDRSVYEDAEIFAENLYLQGAMTSRDHATYRAVYQLLISFLEPPDLIVYMKASTQTLRERIRMRDRDFEQSIPDSYLEQLNTLYDGWIARYAAGPVLTIDTAEIDIINHPEDLESVVQRIDEAMKGKQGILFS